jgi:hypothetical protein
MVPLLEEGDNMWKEKRRDGVTLKVLELLHAKEADIYRCIRSLQHQVSIVLTHLARSLTSAS